MRFPLKIAARDLVILGLTLALWAWSSRLQSTPSALAVPVSVLTGLMTVALGFLGHEWGHLTGALLSRSTFEPADRLSSVFLFRFNSDLNTRAQFMAMSYGGFARARWPWSCSSG